MAARYFPMFMDLRGRKILVVGGGNVAAQRIAKLKDFGCRIMVVAKKMSDALLEIQDKSIVLYERAYDSTDIIDMDYVIAATNDAQLNEKIVWDCNRSSIPVNDVSNSANCDFYFPGIVEWEEMVIGISSSGTNYALTKKLAQLLRLRIGEMVKESREDLEKEKDKQWFV